MPDTPMSALFQLSKLGLAHESGTDAGARLGKSAQQL
jgi:hypothetical protein